jgi:hypothetical protein
LRIRFERSFFKNRATSDFRRIGQIAQFVPLDEFAVSGQRRSCVGGEGIVGRVPPRLYPVAPPNRPPLKPLNPPGRRKRPLVAPPRRPGVVDCALGYRPELPGTPALLRGEPDPICDAPRLGGAAKTLVATSNTKHAAKDLIIVSLLPLASFR